MSPLTPTPPDTTKAPVPDDDVAVVSAIVTVPPPVILLLIAILPVPFAANVKFVLVLRETILSTATWLAILIALPSLEVTL